MPIVHAAPTPGLHSSFRRADLIGPQPRRPWLGGRKHPAPLGASVSSSVKRGQGWPLLGRAVDGV